MIEWDDILVVKVPEKKNNRDMVQLYLEAFQVAEKNGFALKKDLGG
ncbi:MAG: hypothetical protein JW776_01240 [Candidatus Lokiarchaeota archaeon]|nr:hypothetical protein [Candidatus Lokiarchaeota archaeon]